MRGEGGVMRRFLERASTKSNKPITVKKLFVILAKVGIEEKSASVSAPYNFKKASRKIFRGLSRVPFNKGAAFNRGPLFLDSCLQGNDRVLTQDHLRGRAPI